VTLIRRLVVILAAGSSIMGCEKEAAFPDQIPGIVNTLGIFHTAMLSQSVDLLDSVSRDREIYADLSHVFGGDSLAVLTRRIHNPIDSAHVIMTVETVAYDTGDRTGRYTLELFMRREAGFFWIVGHRLSHSLQ
jgi:hypothetical protein